MKNFFKEFNITRAYYSGEKVFSVIGVGSVLASFATMKMWMLAPGFTLLGLTWYGIYRIIEVSK